MRKIFILLSTVLLHSAAQAQLAAYLPPGVIAWFPFTGNAVDSSGHGHDGTVTGCTMTAGRYGVPNTAYYFNGASDFIYIPPGLPGAEISTDITSSLTISAWVKSQNYSYSAQEQIYWRGDPTPAHDPHMLYIISNEVKIRRDVDPGTTINEVGTPVTGLDTNFHMLTGSYDSISGVMKVYIDGSLMNSAVLPGLETYPTSTMYNYIGAVDGGTWQFFYGVIDELAIWKRALTDCEVMSLYYSKPDILTSQPVNDTLAPGGTARFSVTDLVPGSTYQWQQNTGTGFVNLTATPPFSGVTTPTLTITPVTTAMNGYQYRCIPISGTCLNDSSHVGLLRVVWPSATPLTNVISTIKITPNPNSGLFTITGQTNTGSEITIEITDILGHSIYSRKTAPVSGQIDENISVSNLAKGIYLLKILSSDESKVLRLLIE